MIVAHACQSLQLCQLAAQQVACACMQEAADILGEMEELRERLAGEQQLRSQAQHDLAALRAELSALTLQVGLTRHRTGLPDHSASHRQIIQPCM